MKPVIKGITQIIAETLTEQLKTWPKINIVAEEGGRPSSLPSILITSPEFTVEATNVAGSEPERKEVHEDKFNGDGKINEFILAEKPLRPLLGVESPIGELKREPDDYTVDYHINKVTFRIPPGKGKSNVLVRYNGARSSAELRSLMLSLKYLIEVRGEDEDQRNEVSLDVLRSLVLIKEVLERHEVLFRILGGRNEIVDGIEGRGKGSTQKIIECSAQTKLTVEMPMSVIEKIVIEKV